MAATTHNQNIVLTIYPATSQLKSRLEPVVGTNAVFTSVRDLRQSGSVGMLKTLRSMRSSKVFLPVEDPEGVHLLQALQIIASFIPSKNIIVVNSNMVEHPVSRMEIAKAALKLIKGGIHGELSRLRAAKEIKKLLTLARIEPDSPAPRRAIYLNANLWFGVKAGGSVGHIAGVVNGLHELGVPVEFFAVGGRTHIRDAVPYTALVSPEQFGPIWENNCYAFHFSVVEQLIKTPAMREFGWLYQRCSVCNYSGVVLSRRLKKPLVLEYNGSEAWVAKNWGKPLRDQHLAEKVEEANLKHAHLIVTISDVLRDELLARGIEAERIVSYPNCIDERIFDPDRFSATDIAALRRRHGIADNALVATFVGTFGQWHGVPVLGAAVRMLLDTRRAEADARKLHFLFVGDGPKMPDLREALGPYVESSYVTLAGLVPQAHAPAYLAASDILMSPHVANPDGSRFFGSPTKLFEYMAMGKPIVASDLDQIGEVLAGSIHAGALDESGAPTNSSAPALLTAPGDVAAIVGGVLYLAKRPELRGVLGANARRLALAKYTWRHHVGAILDRVNTLGLMAPH